MKIMKWLSIYLILLIRLRQLFSGKHVTHMWSKQQNTVFKLHLILSMLPWSYMTLKRSHCDVYTFQFCDELQVALFCFVTGDAKFSRGEFTAKTRSNGHMRVTKWWIKDIAFWLWLWRVWPFVISQRRQNDQLYC